MGTLHYGTSAFELDDDTLRHFSAVMVAKLRRKESFLAVVRDDADGFERVWLHPTADLRLATMPTAAGLDQQRLHHMMAQANKGAVDLCERWGAPVAAVA